MVDEAALAEAVVSGHIAGVAVDVLDGEERGETGLNPLFRCALAGHNALITPHLGGATYELIAHAGKSRGGRATYSAREACRRSTLGLFSSHRRMFASPGPEQLAFGERVADDTIASNQCRTRIDPECAR